jgi:predicted phosphodiesterase
MRVAALYDIHANLPALEAVLARVKAREPDVILIGGDIAWGPFPRETVSSLRDLGDRAIFIRGNADREVANPEEADLQGSVVEVTDWCFRQLSDDQRDFLRSLPLTVSLEFPGLGPTLFCHATPSSDSDIFTAITPEDRVLDIIGNFRERVLVCGHTHVQFDRTVDDKRLINAGSVGLPYADEPGAYWAWFDDEGVALEKTGYDVRDAARAISSSGCPQADEFAKDVLTPQSSKEATEFFEGRRRTPQD